MNACCRCDLHALPGGAWILRQEPERPLKQVVVALRLLYTELRHAIHEDDDDGRPCG